MHNNGKCNGQRLCVQATTNCVAHSANGRYVLAIARLVHLAAYAQQTLPFTLCARHSIVNAVQLFRLLVIFAREKRCLHIGGASSIGSQNQPVFMYCTRSGEHTNWFALYSALCTGSDISHARHTTVSVADNFSFVPTLTRRALAIGNNNNSN